MTTEIAVTIDQLGRPSPGGIGTYVRGLLAGLNELRSTDQLAFDVVGVANRRDGSGTSDPEGVRVVRTRFGSRATTQLWRFGSAGVPSSAAVVHATTMAGPFRGGRADATRSVLVHDVLWRDHPELTTRRGASFHEQRLGQIRRRDELRVFVTSTSLRQRLVDDGFDQDRLFVVRLGVSQRVGAPSLDIAKVLESLGATDVVGPTGNYSLTVGTIQPRKNLERLIVAHARARTIAPELGPLLIVGARGWGGVDTTGATELGALDGPTLDVLVAGARVAIYVPIEEGWGLPAVEALAAGRPLVASKATPSVTTNDEAIVVDPLDLDDMTQALVRATEMPDDELSREQRRRSVSELTWLNCARDHWAAWS